jgi:tRNA A-37 threonylcarbamoyl transferase component Bud32
VKLFEIIRGKSWNSTEWKTPAAKLKALAQLDKHIHTMNKAGIIHQDLHGDNVMVTPSGRVYIIDYELASYSKDAEAGRLEAFNDSVWETRTFERDKYIKYVFQTLLDEGSLRLTATETKKSQNSTRKSSIKKSGKTRHRK